MRRFDRAEEQRRVAALQRVEPCLGSGLDTIVRGGGPLHGPEGACDIGLRQSGYIARVVGEYRQHLEGHFDLPPLAAIFRLCHTYDARRLLCSSTKCDADRLIETQLMQMSPVLGASAYKYAIRLLRDVERSDTPIAPCVHQQFGVERPLLVIAAVYAIAWHEFWASCHGGRA